MQMLEAVNANFRVTPVAAEFGGRQFPQHQLWMREDNGVIGDCLGCFGNRRQPQQPIQSRSVLPGLLRSIRETDQARRDRLRQWRQDPLCRMPTGW